MQIKLFLILILIVTACGPEKSSKIPDRRDFPVNHDINACKDFYGYTCSKTNESFKLREDRSRHAFAFHDSAERILEAKKEYFKKLQSLKPGSAKEEMLKNYYTACIDGDAGKTDELLLVVRIQRELEGLNTRKEIVDFFASKTETADEAPVEFGVIANQDNPDYNDIYLLPVFMTLPEKTYYEKKEVTSALKKVITLFFKTIKTERAEERALKVYQFEKGLAEVFPTPTEFRTLVATRTYVPRKTMIDTYPGLKLGVFLEKVPVETRIRNFAPRALEYLDESLKNLSFEELKDIYLYFSLNEYLDDAYPEFFQKKFQFEHDFLGGPAERPDRHERCTTATMQGFTKEIDYVMLPELFPGFPRKKVVQMAEKIRSSILSTLRENTWLSAGAKREAIEKIETARLQLVSPENENEWDFNLPAEYSIDKPLQNYKTLKLMKKKKMLNELGKPTDPSRWAMGPLTVNAYYSPPLNKFVLPVAILQYPMYNPGQPVELNLAAIGTVIGHELGHAIDDKGSKYDASGKLRNWLTDSDQRKLHSRSRPLVEQFNLANHNGELTLGENIGDLVGLTASYRAAFRDGGTVDMKKKFFTQYARMWCEVERPSSVERRLKTDPHALGKSRVNEQVKHQPGFAEAFGCKPIDPMTLPPANIVRIW